MFRGGAMAASLTAPLHCLTLARNAVWPAAASSWASRAYGSDAGRALAVCSLHGKRGVVKVKGTDVWRFLQGLITNDIYKLRDEAGTSIMYTAILNPQGRCLYDLLMHKNSVIDPEALWLDVEKGKTAEILSLLQRYKLRSKVELLNVSDSYTVWASISGAAARQDQGDTPNVEWATDPRLPQLGLRTLMPTGCTPGGTPVPDEQYTEKRFQLGVAEGATEIPSGSALPLEYNLDALNGISFSKGCYVGQELTARTHFQGVIRKRLTPFRVPQGSQVKAGDKITSSTDGKRSAGTVNAVTKDGYGLALMRLGAMKEALSNEAQLTVGEDLTMISPAVPDWWPREWMESAAEKE